VVRNRASHVGGPRVIPDTSAWSPIGRSGNAEFFEVEPGVLAVVPFDGSSDDSQTAVDSVRIQLEHLRTRGQRAGTVVFMDRIVAQTSGARDVYRDAPDPTFQTCFALVGSTAFGRAVSSVFMGLRPPRVPTRMFGTFEEAVSWIRKSAGTR
jgi:hypothetical protein